jgi:acetyl esterase/lipase
MLVPVPVPVRIALAAAAATLLIAAPAQAGVQKGVVYGSGKTRAGSKRLLVDLYTPTKKSKGKRPIVVLIHGGGFKNGSRSQADLVRIANALVKRGDVVASIDYRLMGDDAVTSKRVKPLADAVPKAAIYNAMVAAVDDTLTAVDYLRTKAKKLNVDMDRLGLIGGSAGAITCDHVAYVLDDFKIKGPKVRFVGDLWGGIFVPPTPSLEQAAKQLEKGEAPLFSVHGDADTTVPVKLDDDLTARARAVGVKVEYDRVPGGKHGFGGTQFFTREVTGGKTAFDRLLSFSRDYLSP